MASRRNVKGKPAEERRPYMEEILILQMGGTIDKDYPRTRKGYAFEIDSPASRRVLNRLKPGRSVLVIHDTVCRKDSLEITDQDRARLVEVATAAPQRRILVTHGTDTLLQTALYLQERLQSCASTQPRMVVLTGAFTPERLKDSDADINIGIALGALQSLPSPSQSRVYVAMNGLVCPCEAMDRDLETGQFIPYRRPRSRDFSQRPWSGDVQPRLPEVKPRSSEVTARPPESRPRPAEGNMSRMAEVQKKASHGRQKSLESLLDQRGELAAESTSDQPHHSISGTLQSYTSSNQPQPAVRRPSATPSIEGNRKLTRQAPSIERKTRSHIHNRPRSAGWEPPDDVSGRRSGYRTSLDFSRYAPMRDTALALHEEGREATDIHYQNERNVRLRRSHGQREPGQGYEHESRDETPGASQGSGYDKHDPYRDSLGSRSDSGLYTLAQRDVPASRFSPETYAMSSSHVSRSSRDTNPNVPVSRHSLNFTPMPSAQDIPPPLPLTSPPYMASPQMTSPPHMASPQMTSPPPTAEEAEAVFTASLQYLLAQRAQSYPLLSAAPPPIPPRLQPVTTTAHTPRREPELNSDPSMPRSTPPPRRPAVRTNGSLVMASSDASANHSPLRRSTAVSHLAISDDQLNNDDGHTNSDDSTTSSKDENVQAPPSESPLVAEQRSGVRRTLPPGWRHLSALTDVVEEEEGSTGRQGSGVRSLLRRLSQGPEVQLRANIGEEYL